MFAQHVNHGQRNSLSGAVKGTGSPISSRHPLFKLLLGGATFLAFLLLPDQTFFSVSGKLAILLVIFLLSGGMGRWRILLRGGEGLVGFLAIFFLCSLLGDFFSGGDSLDLFFRLALKSFWALAVSLLLFGTLTFAECVYLAGLLRIPARVSVQALLIILIGQKIIREFARMPTAWKSRGLTPRCLRKHPVRVTGLLTVILLRVIRQGGRLEQALLSRGFNGRLYTCFSARWRAADSAALFLFLTAGLGLVVIPAVL